MSSTMQNKASLPVIKRLPKYYRYLSNLQADGRDKISSSELARMMGGRELTSAALQNAREMLAAAKAGDR